MKTLTALDLEAVTGGQALPLGAPDLPNVQFSKVCSTATGTYDGGAALPVAGTWRTRQCVDAKTGTLSGSYNIAPKQPK